MREFKLHWIEEPTNPDDVLAHQAIAQVLVVGGFFVVAFVALVAPVVVVEKSGFAYLGSSQCNVLIGRCCRCCCCCYC